MKALVATMTILCLTAVIGGCANPLNQVTSNRYGDQCADAERSGWLDLAEQACYRALVNVNIGNLGDEQRSIRMYDLGRIKRQLHKLDEAERLFKDSLAIEDKKATPSYEKIGRRLAELAAVYGGKQQCQTGLPYIERLYSLPYAYEGREKDYVAILFWAYSQELQKQQPSDLSKKLASRALEMGFDPKKFEK
jgi:hypothetical protein